LLFQYPARYIQNRKGFRSCEIACSKNAGHELQKSNSYSSQTVELRIFRHKNSCDLWLILWNSCHITGRYQVPICMYICMHAVAQTAFLKPDKKKETTLLDRMEREIGGKQ